MFFLNNIEKLLIMFSLLNLSIMTVLKPLGLGLYMFFCSLISAFIMKIVIYSWYSFIFFLVYIGGLLVLFFYVISLSFNPKKKMKLNNSNIVFFMILILMLKMFKKMNFFVKKNSLMKLKYFDYSKKLFSLKENWFLMFLVLLLFLVLWIITKLIFYKRMAIRFLN